MRVQGSELVKKYPDKKLYSPMTFKLPGKRCEPYLLPGMSCNQSTELQFSSVGHRGDGDEFM